MSGVKTRDQITSDMTWDSESVYATPEAWEVDFKRLPALLEPVVEMKGKLTTAENVAEVFRREDALSLTLEKLHLYAHMLEDQDTQVGENQARMGRLKSQFAKISGQIAWISPEILTQSEETLNAWANDPALAAFKRSMTLLIRNKPHMLSSEEETLLGLASDALSTPYQTFSVLTNADMTFDPAVDAQGKEHEVTNGSYSVLLQESDRQLRESAFSSIYKGYGEHENGLTALLAGSTKHHAFEAQVRKHNDSLDASLFTDNIPREVYLSLIEAVHDALPAFYEYVDLRSRQLGLEGSINMWDFHVPIVPEFQLEVGWRECREWLEEAFKPLGGEYMKGVVESFSARWYDVFENKGKRSGAYSTGAYGEKPFMLLNYHGTLDDVFTVAHELGHSMHTYLSQSHQSYREAGYPIFLAEIASTTNEALLHHYLMQTKEDSQIRAFLLNHLCDSFKGTMFRQTMFAEFELEIHKRVENGEALTADSLKEYYYELNKKYYGPNVDADERIGVEFSRIPHFYYNFYVYKYATGFAAAQIFAQQVLSGEEGRDRYLGFLKSGGSKDPLDTVREAGVDLSNPAVIRKAFETFKVSVKELSDLLQPVG